MLRLEGVSIFRHLVCNGGMGHTDYYDHREIHRDGSILSFPAKHPVVYQVGRPSQAASDSGIYVS